MNSFPARSNTVSLELKNDSYIWPQQGGEAEAQVRSVSHRNRGTELRKTYADNPRATSQTSGAPGIVASILPSHKLRKPTSAMAGVQTSHEKPPSRVVVPNLIGDRLELVPLPTQTALIGQRQ